MADTGRKRLWMATIFFDNNMLEEEIEYRINYFKEKFDIGKPKINWVKGQVEKCPTTGRLHLQIAMQYKDAKEMRIIQTFWETQCHCEPITHDKTGIYGCKEETRAEGFEPIRWGDCPADGKGTQGKRNDLKAIKAAIKEGKTKFEIQEEFDSACRLGRFIDEFTLGCQKPRSEMTKLYIIYGPGGTGKSRFAFDNCPSAFWNAGMESYKWFDGYRGQDTMVLDEFDPKAMPFRKLKLLLDRYPIQVELKGTSTNFIGSRIIIISNYDPRTWYSSELLETEAWTRRVTGICHLKKFGDEVRFCTWDDWVGTTPITINHLTANLPVPGPIYGVALPGVTLSGTF